MKKSLKILSIFLTVLTILGMFSVATPILAADIQSETLELNYSSEAIENVETSESVEAVEPLELVQDYAYIENFESVEEELKNTYG